ncbi:nitric oxide synthase oxygenase [Streptomyces telluris]|uniref:Nitric oxide synthase oxygenase n=1 Tax=Streptomyces telluris TaxID=2720021 RepID=A0A9X2LK91_9ACTN|nr:nitric oxide synthase oxygenase [Streptomyces telluris]MCQ8772402.1 nitric oxide synthase oxygenase [Streptomyces telluris]NJP76928.1 nitric oxide synthase oxygenase [Streptomyces telluris]
MTTDQRNGRQPRAVVDQGEAERFVRQFHDESGLDDTALHTRLIAIRRQIAETGTYRHTPEELVFGAKVAWRNSARCIGRLYWQSLRVRDRRHVTNAADVAAECLAHLRTATNAGRIRPVVTVFPQDDAEGPPVLIWNEQLIRYAGYLRFEGGYTGDPGGFGLAELAAKLGWEGAGGRFDVLPLIIQTRGNALQMFEVPPEDVLEVPLSHPALPWFAELGLRWHAVPAISHMRLRIGGISYSAAPFNGWYMGTEIGVRNLCDADRYDILPEVGRRLGLDTSSTRTLWRDQALVEVNRAVLHSFDAAGVTIADHHTESARFLRHLAREELAGRSCPADWSWIVPPMSGALTPVFHRYYDESRPRPDFHLDDGARLRARGVPAPPYRRCTGPGPAWCDATQARGGGRITP